MLGCPNKSSKEWKEILKKANGVKSEAIKLWNKTYPENENINPLDTAEETESVEDIIGEESDIEDKSTDFKNLIDNIKIYLHKQLAILKKKVVTNQTAKQLGIENTIKKLENLDDVAGIDEFITIAYNDSIKVKKRYAKFIKNKDTLPRKEAIKELMAIYEYASSYNMLDEISILNKESFLNSNDNEIKDSLGKFTPQYKLSQALTIRNYIQESFEEEGIPLMADYLWQFKGGYESKNLEQQIKYYQDKINTLKSTPGSSKRELANATLSLETVLSLKLDKKGLENLLKQALRDESTLDYLIGPLISSPDAVLALFAKSVKYQLEKARLVTLKTRDLIMDKFDAYEKINSKSKSNPKEFNEGIYELLETKLIKEDGTEETVLRPAFVQKYDYNGYTKARNNFFNSNPKPTGKQIGLWLQQNKQPKPKAERDEIINEKKRLLEAKVITDSEYALWLNSVTNTNFQGEITYNRELSEPSDKWINNKWLDLYTKDGIPKNVKGELHKINLDTYLEDQKLLPKTSRPGYFLPYVPKTDWERATENTIGSTIKRIISDKLTTQVYDVGSVLNNTDQQTIVNPLEEGDEGFTFKDSNEKTSLTSLGGQEVKFIPTYFIQKIDVNDISLDVTRSVLLFHQMAQNYNAINEISGETAMLKTIVKKRKVVETTSSGENILDAFAKKYNIKKYINKSETSNSEKHLDAFIDMVVYGEMSKIEKYGSIDFAKITDTLIGYSAISGLALDPMKAVANGVQGNIQLIIEAASGQYFNSRNLANGKLNYKLGAAFLRDFGKTRPVTLEGQLAELYDAMQGEFKDEYGRKVTQAAFLRLFNTNSLFAMMHAVEHEIQITTMFALMDAEKVIDNVTNKEMSLFEAHKKYGKDGVIENTNFTEKKQFDFTNRLHAINKSLQGVYNDFDKSTAQRLSVGRLLLMYRKHMYPAYMRRFKSFSYDYEADDITQGFYRTFWNTLVKDVFLYRKNIIKEWSNYTPYQKSQINKTVRELVLIVTAMSLLFILASAADDDEDLKNSTIYNHVYYQLIRLKSETIQYYPIVGWKEGMRLLQSPTAATNTLKKIGIFADQFFLTWSEDKLTYQRDTGVWEKGDNKSWAYFLKLIGFSGNNFNPEESIKSYESLTR